MCQVIETKDMPTPALYGNGERRWEVQCCDGSEVGIIVLKVPAFRSHGSLTLSNMGIAGLAAL
jgi:hypothetical protein